MDAVMSHPSSLEFRTFRVPWRTGRRGWGGMWKKGNSKEVWGLLSPAEATSSY
jgi:hypothetical protein